MKLSCIKIGQCFSKPYETSGGDANVKVNLPNYAAKADCKMQRELIHIN